MSVSPNRGETGEQIQTCRKDTNEIEMYHLKISVILSLDWERNMHTRQCVQTQVTIFSHILTYRFQYLPLQEHKDGVIASQHEING